MIRKATRADVPGLLDLYDTFHRPPDPRPAPADAEATLAAIENQGGTVFVDERDGTLCGTCAVYLCANLTRGLRPFAVIENVVCLPAWRGRGVGRGLMQHAQDFAVAQGCYKAMLQTGRERTDNHAFYRACGFVDDKRAFQIRFNPA